MMDIKKLLNTDVSALSHGLQRSWLWWISELRAMLPPGLFGSSEGKARLIAEFKDDNLLFYEYRYGTSVAIPYQSEPARLLTKAFFAMPDACVLTREVTYPPLPMSDLRRLAALDMDRLTPLRSDDVVFDLDVQPGPDGMRRVTVGVVRRRTVEDILAKLWSFGAEPSALGLIARHGGVPRFNFLRAAQIPGRRPLLGLRSGSWWMIAALLFTGNIAVLVAKDAYNVAALESAVEAQRSSVVLASSLRRRVEQEARRRSVVINSLKRATPLAMLDGVTEALPDGVSVHRLEWNGKSLHVLGVTPPDQDISALLNASALVRGESPETARTASKNFGSSEKVGPEVVSANKPSAGPVAGAAREPPAVAPGIFDVTVDIKAPS